MATQRWKNNGLVLEARQDDDSDYAPIKAKSLYLDGSGDVATGINGALAAANTGITNAAAAQADATAALAAAGSAANVYSSSMYLNPQQLKIVAPGVGFGAVTFDAAQETSAYYVMSGLNSEMSWRAALHSGNYLVVGRILKNSNCGDYKLYVDTVDKGGDSGYNATVLRNQTISYGPFSIASSGEHLFSLKTYQKNGSSSAYVLALSYLLVLRTDA